MKYVLAIALCVCFSCSDNSSERKMNDVFSEDISLVADKLPINEVINPVSIVKLKDFLVVQNEYIINNSSKVYHHSN